MIRILFVDDEPHVLDGIRRSMRSMRGQWEMRFSASGADALRTVSLWSADVIVTDMQMPGMGGVQLLSEIKRLYPGMIRFVLSGHAEPSVMVQAAATAHQFLAKPCDAEVLKAAITRARALRGMLSDGRIASWTGTAEALPILPAAFHHIIACLQNDTASIADISAVIVKDLAVSTMLLKLANSAFFGLGQSIRTIERAVSFLGIEIVASLVLTSGVFKTSVALRANFNTAALWEHSLQTAALARELALHENWPAVRADDAFLAGMLHDLGHLVIATASSVSDIARLNDIDHGQVGAYLVGLWGFPDGLVEAIAFHDRPSRAGDSEMSLAGLVHAASLLTSGREKDGGVAIDPDMDQDFFRRPGMADRWQMWQACVTPASLAKADRA